VATDFLAPLLGWQRPFCATKYAVMAHFRCMHYLTLQVSKSVSK